MCFEGHLKLENSRSEEHCTFFLSLDLIIFKLLYVSFLQARNAKFQYSLSGDPDHVFKIDPSIGRIELNKSVDFETKQHYKFWVRIVPVLILVDETLIAV